MCPLTTVRLLTIFSRQIRGGVIGARDECLDRRKLATKTGACFLRRGEIGVAKDRQTDTHIYGNLEKEKKNHKKYTSKEPDTQQEQEQRRFTRLAAIGLAFPRVQLHDFSASEITSDHGGCFLFNFYFFIPVSYKKDNHLIWRSKAPSSSRIALSRTASLMCVLTESLVRNVRTGKCFFKAGCSYSILIETEPRCARSIQPTFK